MGLVKTVSFLLSTSALSLFLAACGVSSLGAGNGGDGGGGGSACSTPNPAGCNDQGCPQGQVCVQEGCNPSSCGCDPATDSWVCTADCGGGTCVPDGSSACAGPNPAGCKTTGCAEGEVCADEGCTSSSCDCDPMTGNWLCTDDCGGGTCVPDVVTCQGPNPQGCSNDNACPPDKICVVSDGGDDCAPSACSCDPATGSWICTADCGAGICVPVI